MEPMVNPDLYRKAGVLSKMDAALSLEEFTINKKWKENARVLDIGCGDGSTNKEVLQKFAPASSRQFVGCDVSQKMVDYAKTHYGDEQTEFLQWDIAEEPPKILRNAFDHAFSFYVLQWLKDQETVFKNIYYTLNEGGNCLLVFLEHDKVTEYFRIFSRSPKWAEYLKDVDIFMSPYCDSQDARKEVTDIMEEVGFKDVQVKVLDKTYVYEDAERFKALVKAINPFRELDRKWDEFMQNFFETVPEPLTFNYKLIVAYGSR